MRDLVYAYLPFFENGDFLVAKTVRNAQLFIVCAAIAITLVHNSDRFAEPVDADKVRRLYDRLLPDQKRRILALLHAAGAEGYIKALNGEESDRLLLLTATMLSAFYNRDRYAYETLVPRLYRKAPRTLLFTASIAVWLISGYKRKSKPSGENASFNPAQNFVRKAFKLVGAGQEWKILTKVNHKSE